MQEQDLITKFTSFSFSILFIERITKLQESREFILNSMEKIYENIDFDILENLNLEELSSEAPINQNIASGNNKILIQKNFIFRFERIYHYLNLYKYYLIVEISQF